MMLHLAAFGPLELHYHGIKDFQGPPSRRKRLQVRFLTQSITFLQFIREKKHFFTYFQIHTTDLPTLTVLPWVSRFFVISRSLTTRLSISRFLGKIFLKWKKLSFWTVLTTFFVPNCDFCLCSISYCFSPRLVCPPFWKGSIVGISVVGMRLVSSSRASPRLDFPEVFVTSRRASDQTEKRGLIGEKIESHYFLYNLQIFFLGLQIFLCQGLSSLIQTLLNIHFGLSFSKSLIF